MLYAIQNLQIARLVEGARDISGARIESRRQGGGVSPPPSMIPTGSGLWMLPRASFDARRHGSTHRIGLRFCSSLGAVLRSATLVPMETVLETAALETLSPAAARCRSAAIPRIGFVDGDSAGAKTDCL